MNNLISTNLISTLISSVGLLVGWRWPKQSYLDVAAVFAAVYAAMACRANLMLLASISAGCCPGGRFSMEALSGCSFEATKESIASVFLGGGGDAASSTLIQEQKVVS